jgi:hypothetical protein
MKSTTRDEVNLVAVGYHYRCKTTWHFELTEKHTSILSSMQKAKLPMDAPPRILLG